MKSQKVLRRIKAKLGSDWPTCKPVPNEMIAELCDAIWEEGGSPTGARLLKLLHLNQRAVFPGIKAWRQQVDLSPDDLQTEVGLLKNKAYLDRLVSPLMAAAPQTCLDSLNDGRWQIPSPKVLAYLGRIRNESVRDSMILAALVVQSTPTALYGGITTFTSCMRVLMADLAVTRISTIDPHEMIPKLYRREIGKNFSDHGRVRLVKVWNQISRGFEEYAARLSDAEVEKLSRFFIQPVTNHRRLRQYSLLPEVLETQQATVKSKTDIVHARFHQLRHIAKMRLNQARRLKEATMDTIAHVISNNLPLPHRFSYEELVTTESGRKFRQRVHLSLWDSKSVYEVVWRLWPTRDGTSKRARARRLVRVSPEYLNYEVEYRAVESLEPGVDTRPYWFIGFYENFLFTVSGDPTLIARQQSFNNQWGYRTIRPWVCSSRLIGSSTSPNARDLTWLQKVHGHVFIPYEGILATCLFASLLIELQTKTGARLGECNRSPRIRSASSSLPMLDQRQRRDGCFGWYQRDTKIVGTTSLITRRKTYSWKWFATCGQGMGQRNFLSSDSNLARRRPIAISSSGIRDASPKVSSTTLYVFYCTGASPPQKAKAFILLPTCYGMPLPRRWPIFRSRSKS